jgi:hypothetical protein
MELRAWFQAQTVTVQVKQDVVLLLGDGCVIMAGKSKCCCLYRANLLFFVLVLLGVVAAAVDANWTQRFLSPESFMETVFPLAALLLIGGVIVLSELKVSCDIKLGKGPERCA